ncbi:glycoside hydrolase family 13 protein [Proteiniclasticum ruminis]|uniref:glycoside hydrolase family 13 protein n=1 Tax=Proteiniclasticum ruminis TaxID=398199 RepID=UPI0028AE04A5|nr:alpha-glucosidase [Proteiniclasticum ruminis]
MGNFKHRIVYQIWPRSFKDSNGDGIGDLQGIIGKLDYIKSLGVDTIWLSPIYATGNKDYGYDIDDYYKINPEFGSMEDFDELLHKSKNMGIDIVMDLVANHTSDQHSWFQEALKSKDSPYRNYYIFKQGKRNKKRELLPPNNWLSAFGGSAWQKDPNSDEFYLTLFTPNQCDLNWKNEKVREGIYEIMRFWLDKGILGFRMDVINTIAKKDGLPPAGKGKKLDFPFEHIVSLPKSHEYVKEMHEKVLSQYEDVFTVGEGMVTSLEDLNAYTRPEEKKLQMMFQFDVHLIGCGPLGKFDFRKGYRWTPKELKDLIIHWQTGVEKGGGWLGNFLSNHDQPRQVSRFGHDGAFRRKSAKSLALLNFTLRGTPFLYQGEEIGMTNCHLKEEDWRDFEAINDYRVLQEMMHLPKPLARKVIQKMTRDHARTPMQWSEEKNAGFTTGTPWMKVNPNCSYINVEKEMKRENSILSFYKKLIEIRKSSEALSTGSFVPVDTENKKVLSYLRQKGEDTYLIVINLSGSLAEANLMDVSAYNFKPVLCTYDALPFMPSMKLQPYEGRLYKV